MIKNIKVSDIHNNTKKKFDDKIIGKIIQFDVLTDEKDKRKLCKVIKLMRRNNKIMSENVIIADDTMKIAYDYMMSLKDAIHLDDVNDAIKELNKVDESMSSSLSKIKAFTDNTSKYSKNIIEYEKNYDEIECLLNEIYN